MLNLVQQALIAKAREKFGTEWFDGDDLLVDFQDGVASQLESLVRRGIFETEGFYLRLRAKQC